MSSTDAVIRKTAVPFTATPFGVNVGIPNDSDALQILDLIFGTAIATPALRVMRLSKPDIGNLTQAYLNLFFSAASSLSAKVAIGRFDTDGVTAVSPTQEEIDAGHLALTGTSSPYASSGGTLIIDGLNLLKKIPKKGEANYNADGFVLIVQFSRNLTTSDRLQRFEVACATEMGLR